MRTPAGQECKYYYEDFHRGRSRQECRLIPPASGARAWRPEDCARCPVPGILWANASPDLELAARIQPGILGVGRTIMVTARCRKHDVDVADPHVGCELCAAERPDLGAFLPTGEDS